LIGLWKTTLLELDPVQVKIRNGQAETLRHHRFRHVASIGSASGPTHCYASRFVNWDNARRIRRAEFTSELPAGSTWRFHLRSPVAAALVGPAGVSKYTMPAMVP